jgi:hypothetical protein
MFYMAQTEEEKKAARAEAAEILKEAMKLVRAEDEEAAAKAKETEGGNDDNDGKPAAKPSFAQRLLGGSSTK